MTSTRLLRVLLITSILLLMAAQAASASGISVWAGVGGAAQDGQASFERDAKQLGLELSFPVVPVSLRADLMLLGSDFSSDGLCTSMNAIYRLGLPVVQPYAVVGAGRYALSPDKKENGWNFGAGARLGTGRLGVFAEVRHHVPLGRTITMAGVTI